VKFLFLQLLRFFSFVLSQSLSTFASLLGPHLFSHPTVEISQLDCARVYPNLLPITSHLLPFSLLFPSAVSAALSLSLSIYLTISILPLPSRAAVISAGGHSLSAAHPPPFSLFPSLSSPCSHTKQKKLELSLKSVLSFVHLPESSYLFCSS